MEEYVILMVEDKKTRRQEDKKTRRQEEPEDKKNQKTRRQEDKSHVNEPKHVPPLFF